ncbi:glutamine--fructose-6-phosphate transaminase (isomerizing) [Candidatus Babeliales bacterium]|nr:glutamine--fructose-6-phosphate transaminase (isomerizing) [Candidatus Babeliales bacterium]
MCGIVSYVGNKSCRQFILDGLTRLEYRGYDSAGIICIDSKHKHFSYQKEAGGISLLKKLVKTTKFDGFIGMGHTRWATHGVVDKANAHPHFNCHKSVAVIHNGIVEGYEKIREELIKENHEFYSTTDTEVIAHLFSSLLTKHKNIIPAVLELTQKLHGAFALVIMMEEYPDQLLLIRRRSPLVIGIGQDEMFAASDYMAFSDQTKTVLFLPDNSFALVKKDALALYDFTGNTVTAQTQTIDQTFSSTDKQGFEHYMLKEIYEQKRAINRTISFFKIIGNNTESNSFSSKEEYNEGIWRQLGLTADQVKNLKSLNLIAAGTSWHAARIAQFFFEIICKIPTRVSLASEFQHMPFFPDANSVYILISQSGETADTLQALRLITTASLQTIALTNVASSTIVREADGFMPMQAGPEISVASTKAFSTQVASLYWLANRIALERGIISQGEMHEAEEDLFITAEILETVIETYKLTISQTLAQKYSTYNRFIFLGRHISYPFALEASLKLKEISYIFSQCYPAGELKHGPIALIDDQTPVVIFSVLDEIIYWKILANAQEVKARHGHLIVFAFEGQKELINLADTAFIIPLVKPLLAPLAMTGIMQYFVYEITRALDRPIDKPRNLAKSVTVE